MTPPQTQLDAPAEPSATVSGRLPQLDGLRGIAILAVLINHAFHVPLTWAGVDLFFVLSGFLITGILLRSKRADHGYFSAFYRRRAVRILPSYFLTIFVFVLAFGWSSLQPWPLLFVGGMNLQVFTPAHVDPLPLWSLAAEEQFYLVWPLVVLLASEKLLLRLAIAAVVLTPFLRALCTPLFPNHFFIYTLTPFRADLLCAGAVVALLWKGRTPRFEQACRRYAPAVCVAAFGMLAVLQHWPMFRLTSNTRWSNASVYSLSLLGSSCLLVWSLADRSWLRGFLSAAWLRFVGKISYTLYLVHVLVFLLLASRTPAGAPLLLASIVATFLWASLSWFLLERPLLRLASRS